MALVILDPGHSPKNDSGQDPGAVGNGIHEADITADVCSRIAAKLPLYGIDNVIIQPDEETLGRVVAEANSHPEASFFLSVHVNSAVNADATGFESFTYPGSQKADNLRFYVHTEVANFYRQYGFMDRGKKTANFAVLRDTSMPAMLFENLFISNQFDAVKLKDVAFLDGLAAAYAKGIARALGYSYKGEVEVVVPDWAKDSVMWAVAHGLIISPENRSEDFYALIRVLYEYDKMKG